MKNRNLNLEALRVVLMMLIILLHLSGIFYNIPSIRSESFNIEASLLLSMRMIFLLGVNTFAFISGYFGIINVRGGQIKFIRYELLALSWGILFVLFDLLCQGHINMRHLVDLMLPSTSGICWYFKAYILLLVLSPIINRGLELLTQRNFALILGFIIVVEFVGGTLFKFNGTTFMQLFYIYLIGRFLNKNSIKILEKKAALLFTFATGFNVIIVFLCSFFQLGGGRLLNMIENNRNPLVLLSAICLFMMFKNGKEIYLSRTIAKLAPYMFSVYISHVSLLYLNILNLTDYVVGNVFFSMFLYSVLLLLFCVVLDKVRFLIFGNFFNKIENSLTSFILKK